MYIQLYLLNTVEGCKLVKIKCTTQKYKLSTHFVVGEKKLSITQLREEAGTKNT